MPGWQRFWRDAAAPDFALISVAIDAGGADAVRPWVDRADAQFPTVIDASNRLGDLYGFTKVPNGLWFDADHRLRYRKEGGFSIDKPEDRSAIERLLAGESAPSPDAAAPYDLPDAARTELRRLAELGLSKLRQGDIPAATTLWRQALRLDPENLLIRKQIWRAEHPERFEPAIDWAWQRSTLAEERAAEIAAGIRDLDGHPRPTVWSTVATGGPT